MFFQNFQIPCFPCLELLFTIFPVFPVFPVQWEPCVFSRGPPKVLAESRKNARGGHFVFQMDAKNIHRQDFMVMNISCKFEKASYNIFFVRAVTVKSLYTVSAASRSEIHTIHRMLSGGYNNVKTNSLSAPTNFFKCLNTRRNLFFISNLCIFYTNTVNEWSLIPSALWSNTGPSTTDTKSNSTAQILM